MCACSCLVFKPSNSRAVAVSSSAEAWRPFVHAMFRLLVQACARLQGGLLWCLAPGSCSSLPVCTCCRAVLVPVLLVVPGNRSKQASKHPYHILGRVVVKYQGTYSMLATCVLSNQGVGAVGAGKHQPPAVPVKERRWLAAWELQDLGGSTVVRQHL